MRAVALGQSLGPSNFDQWVEDCLREIELASYDIRDLDVGRETLTADRTYYVRADGDDSNSGLSDSATGAFLTGQAAINLSYTLDLGGFDITIQFATGTYTGTMVIDKPFVGGKVTLVGDTITPSNVLLNVTGAALSCTGFGSRIYIKGFKIVASGAAIGPQVGGYVEITGKMEYGACGFHIAASLGGNVSCFSQAYTISGNAGYHIYCSTGLVMLAGCTVTLTGTPAFTDFASVDLSGQIVAHANSYTGAATGQRYLAVNGGGIYTAGGGANYFPGNSAGSATSPGYYV